MNSLVCGTVPCTRKKMGAFPLEYTGNQQQELRVNTTHHSGADKGSMSSQAQEKVHKNLKDALKACGYPNWAFMKIPTRFRRNTNTAGGEEKNKYNNVVITYVLGVSEKLSGIFDKH